MIADSLHTARLMLRRPDAADVAAYTAYCGSERSKFVGGPFSPAQAFEKYCAMAGHWHLRGFGRYIMIRDGAAIGHVGPLAIDDSHAPEMTWTLWDSCHEGQGYASEAARAVADHLMGDNAWPAMIIRIQPDNTGSVRIAERIGARRGDDPAPAWYPGAVTYHLRAEVMA